MHGIETSNEWNSKTPQTVHWQGISTTMVDVLRCETLGMCVVQLIVFLLTIIEYVAVAARAVARFQKRIIYQSCVLSLVLCILWPQKCHVTKM